MTWSVLIGGWVSGEETPMPKDNKPRRVIHGMAKIPAPTSELLERLAIAMYQAFADRLTIGTDLELNDWVSSSDTIRDAWRAAAVRGYTTIALAGGAGLVGIEEPDD